MRSRFAAASLGFVLSGLVSGCGPLLERDRVERTFARAYHCGDAVVRSSGGGWVAQGCGVTAAYACPLGVRPLTFGRWGCRAIHVTRRSAPRPPPPPRVRTFEHEDGFAVLSAELPADRARLRLIAAPTRDAGHAFVELRWTPPIEDDGAAALRVVVDGEDVPLDQRVVVPADDGLARRARLPRAWLERWALAASATAHVGTHEIALGTSALGVVRDFTARFRTMAAARADDATPP